MEQQNSNNKYSIVISGDNNRTESKTDNCNNTNSNNTYIFIEQNITCNIVIEQKKESKIKKSLTQFSSDIKVIKDVWINPREMVNKSLIFKNQKSLLKYIFVLTAVLGIWLASFKRILISLFIIPLFYTVIGSYYLKVTHNHKNIKRQLKLYFAGVLSIVGSIVLMAISHKFNIIPIELMPKLFLIALIINLGTTCGLFANSFGGELPKFVPNDQEAA